MENIDLSSLPVSLYEDQIVKSIKEFRVTIISAETGAGKSTQVPIFLHRAGLRPVITQPRRLAVRSVAARVAKLMNVKLGETVGYRIGGDSCSSESTQCLFVTDGLEMVREIQGEFRPDVLVIDEAHEWNVNIETLVAWSRKHLQENPDFRLVIMSATIEADRLREYFSQIAQVNLIEVPGRIYRVDNVAPRQSQIAMEVYDWSKKGNNVLVFLPGKAEIADTAKQLDEMSLQAEILPLHGELESAEQDRVFRRYGRPKVVLSTNVAQTSITIDDIDVVVDCGTEKRVETVNGVEGLYERRTSVADDRQRMGRAGRCKEGIYVNMYGGYESQLEFPLPEIQRLRLDQLVLRLAIAGYDATELEFFHQPPHEVLLEAKKLLGLIGALDEGGQVTEIGDNIAALPIDVKLARMIYEGYTREVLDDVITIAACLEVNGIGDRKSQFATSERQSDLLVELEMFKKASLLNSDEMMSLGVHVKKYFQAVEVRRNIVNAIKLSARKVKTWINFESIGNRRDIIISCLSGMVDHIYFCNYDQCHDVNGMRQINRHSRIRQGPSQLVFGQPLDLEVKKLRRGRPAGKQVLRLVTMVTVIDTEMIREVAPWLLKVTCTNISYDEQSDLVSFRQKLKVNGQVIESTAQDKMMILDELPKLLPPAMTAEEFMTCWERQMFDEARRPGGLLDKARRQANPNEDCVYAELFGKVLTAYAAPDIIYGVSYYFTKEEAEQARLRHQGTRSRHGLLV